MEVVNKLTADESFQIWTQANQKVLENKGYRLGQAIMNLLPKPLYREISMTELDLFFMRSNDRVRDIFYSKFIIQE